MNEADTCQTYILPKLKTSGWEDVYFTEQMVLTHGPSVVHLDNFPARLTSLRRLQSAAEVELRPLFFAERTLMPSILDKAFKGEL